MGTWKRIRGLLRTLVRFLATALRAVRGLPLVGEIEGRFDVIPAVIDDPVFGRSARYPTVLEIVVSDRERWPLRVGRLVNDRFFAGDPPIVFNVCFSCHEPDPLGRSEYADPTSHWFNVFFGFYEIDVPCGEWRRPFGFKTGDPVAPEVDFHDLLRIGKSDWNYFSNYMYGVPARIAAAHDALDDPQVATRVSPAPVVIGGARFWECEVDGLEVVTGYAGPRGGLRDNVWFFTPVWRRVFGTCAPRAGHDESFVGARMKLRFLMRWERGPDEDLGCEAFKTFIYGGSINKGYPDAAFNERFLEAQLAAVKRAAFRKKERR
jgi:hypothetical protein